jgi:CubicO group peptidase (beta-lactamase class C family)
MKISSTLQGTFLAALLLWLALAVPTAAQTLWPIPDWTAATPESQGMSSGDLADLVDSILKQGDPIHQLLVIRNGRIVLEAAFPPFRKNAPHSVYSCTKSVTSTLIGIAMGQGKIGGVDRRVLSFFPERQIAHRDARKEAMTLEHLLTMTTGLDWSEWGIPYGNPDNISWKWLRSPDAVQFVLDAPMSVDPGSRFNYNSGASHLLAAILRKETGQSPLAFAREQLFQPLGISDVLWQVDAQGLEFGGTGLVLRPRDLARIGYLFLQGGSWQGRRIVPAEWVRNAVASHVSVSESQGYGYQWWVESKGGYAAQGFGGQTLWVVPELQLIVVTTAGAPGEDATLPRTLMELFVLPAARSAGPLPENPAGQARLAAALRAAEQPVARPVPPLPAVARKISGRIYKMGENQLGWQTIALTFQGAEVHVDLASRDGTDHFSAGLDGLFRTTKVENNVTLAARGRWEKDGEFVLRVYDLAETSWSESRFRFTNDRVEIALDLPVSGYREAVRGIAGPRRTASHGKI